MPPQKTEPSQSIVTQPITKDDIWEHFFDGSYSKEGAGADVVLIYPHGETIPLSFQLEFYTTNNVVEYEALILGMETAQKMGVKILTTFGYSELVVQQVSNRYQAKNPRMRFIEIKRGILSIISLILSISLPSLDRKIISLRLIRMRHR